MADEIDRAQSATEVYQDAAMRSHKAKRAAACEIRLPRVSKYVSRPCLDCGRPIPEARMKVNPEADRCVPCQTFYERGGDE